MKNALPILLLIILSTCGCGGDSTTTPDVEDDAPLAADTIGAAGGTLEIEDFALNVPPGAFDSDIELALYETSEDHGFGDNCVSRFFRLEGLPESFSESLRVRIGYLGDVGEDVLIAHGRAAAFYGADLNTFTGLSYDFYNAAEESGFLEAVIPGPESEILQKDVRHSALAGPNSTYLVAVKNTKLEGKTDHFRFSYPLGLYGYVDNIAGYLEAAFDTVESLGIGYSGKWWEWPAAVTVRPYEYDEPVGLNLGMKDKIEITVDAASVTEDNLPNLGVLLGRMMVIAAQSIPKPESIFEGDNEAWNAAVCAWLDEKFSDPAQFIRPLGFGGKESYALQGVPVGIPSATAEAYGVGWAPVVGHIVGNNGTDIIGDIYEAMRTSKANPFHELFDRLSGATYNWFPEFVADYVTGKIYEVDSAILLARIPSKDTRSIGGIADTADIFQRHAEHLSARMYRIMLDYTLISRDASMQLTAASADIDNLYLTLFVYKAKDGVLEYIGGGNTVVVDSLRHLTTQGYDIVAVETVSYTEAPFTDKPVTRVRYRISTGPTFRSCLIRIGLNAIFQTEGAARPDTSYLLPSWRAVGGFSGYTFSGEIDRSYHGENTTGSVTVTLDPATMEATTFSTNAVTTDAWGISSWGMTGIFLPVKIHVPDEALEHRVEGATTCSHISAYNWSYEPYAGARQDVIGWICEQDAGIEIQFYRWE